METATRIRGTVRTDARATRDCPSGFVVVAFRDVGTAMNVAEANPVVRPTVVRLYKTDL